MVTWRGLFMEIYAWGQTPRPPSATHWQCHCWSPQKCNYSSLCLFNKWESGQVYCPPTLFYNFIFPCEMTWRFRLDPALALMPDNNTSCSNLIPRAERSCFAEQLTCDGTRVILYFLSIDDCFLFPYLFSESSFRVPFSSNVMFPMIS